MGAFGFQNAKKIASSHQTKFQRPTAIIISSENIPATATLRRATFHRALRRKYATKVAVSVLVDAACISIVPMRIYPAVHYTMGGLWVDYNLMSNVPGLFVIGEANFSDHGANRLGASALMQGLADGYFILPYTLGDYLAKQKAGGVDAQRTEFKDAERQQIEKIDKLLRVNGKRTVDSFHREL